jgi:hypothetical protein
VFFFRQEEAPAEENLQQGLPAGMTYFPMIFPGLCRGERRGDYEDG